MNAQFHTPSFGDEVFDLTEIDYNNSANSATSNSTPSNFQQQHQQSKRMRGSMDNSVDEYHSANDESFNSAAQIASPTTPTATATVAARKQLTTNDPSEPAKPLSAYALFFRDTVSAIKQQNPNCSFQELSRIVASMWEALDPTHKNVYNKKNELAKNEYIKQMRIFRQQQQQLLEQQRLEHAATPVLQSKPAVFTISNHSVTSPQPQVQSQSQFQSQQTQYQPQFDVQPQQQEQYTNQQEQAEQQQKAKPFNNDVDSQPPAQQIQMLTEAGSVQKCIRDSCSKRAIINPDWEDEYCSNECVVIHCRNVFSLWVQSNLDARTQ